MGTDDLKDDVDGHAEVSDGSNDGYHPSDDDQGCSSRNQKLSQVRLFDVIQRRLVDNVHRV